MARPTKAQLKQKCEELLALQTAYDRYKDLERQVKDDMALLKQKEIVIPAKGRVFISQSERVTVPVSLAREILGPKLAPKVIQIKESVSNNLIKAFVEVGDIDDGQRQRLLDEAEKTPIISLYVRPLK